MIIDCMRFIRLSYNGNMYESAEQGGPWRRVRLGSLQRYMLKQELCQQTVRPGDILDTAPQVDALKRYIRAMNKYAGKGEPAGVIMSRRDFEMMEGLAQFRDIKGRPIMRGVPFDWTRQARVMIAVGRMP